MAEYVVLETYQGGLPGVPSQKRIEAGAVIDPTRIAPGSSVAALLAAGLAIVEKTAAMDEPLEIYARLPSSSNCSLLSLLVAFGAIGAGDVSSVFGRTGAVTAQGGDYAASDITNDSGVAGATVADALDNVSPPVDSVFGRTGAVTAQSGDYTSSQVANGSTVPGGTVTQALESAATTPAPPVGSVFGRTGAVTAQSGDYAVAQVTGAEAVANKGQANGYASLNVDARVVEPVQIIHETGDPADLIVTDIPEDSILVRRDTNLQGREEFFTQSRSIDTILGGPSDKLGPGLGDPNFTQPAGGFDLSGGTYEIEWGHGWALDTTTSNFIARLFVNGAEITEPHVQEPKDSAGAPPPIGTDQRLSFDRGPFRVVLPAGATPVRVEWQAQNAGDEATIFESSVKIVKVAS